jgi:hypothetical protein
MVFNKHDVSFFEIKKITEVESRNPVQNLVGKLTAVIRSFSTFVAIFPTLL